MVQGGFWVFFFVYMELAVATAPPARGPPPSKLAGASLAALKRPPRAAALLPLSLSLSRTRAFSSKPQPNPRKWPRWRCLIPDVVVLASLHRLFLWLRLVVFIVYARGIARKRCEEPVLPRSLLRLRRAPACNLRRPRPPIASSSFLTRLGLASASSRVPLPFSRVLVS